MKSNKKGFTLIELLAVIVILAIIALIATPVVLNVISKVKISAAENSVYGMMDAIEYVYYESVLTNEISLPLVVTCTNDACTYTVTKADSTTEQVPVKSKGKQPIGGTFTLQKTTGTFADVAEADAIQMAGNIKCTISNQKVTCSQG